MGKNVKLTPINNSQKTPEIREFLILVPEKIGIHKVKPAKIPNTAPKLNTKWK
jgi:hypothetical protein